MRIFARYLAFQLPGALIAAAVLFGLWSWQQLRADLALGLLGLWVLKDLALYPLVRRGYDDRPSEMVGVEQVVGALGTVAEDLAPEGWVRLGGELWRAETAAGALARGSRVRVLEVRGLRLRVAPAADSAPPVQPLPREQNR